MTWRVDKAGKLVAKRRISDDADGYRRYIDDWVERLRAVFTGDYLHQRPLVERGVGRQTWLPVRTLGISRSRSPASVVSTFSWGPFGWAACSSVPAERDCLPKTVTAAG